MKPSVFQLIDKPRVTKNIFQVNKEFDFSGEVSLENDGQLEILLKENSPAILYSYLRPIRTKHSVDANLPPLVIPLMDFRK